MSPSFIGSIGKHNGDALLYQTDEHRGVGGGVSVLKAPMHSRDTGWSPASTRAEEPPRKDSSPQFPTNRSETKSAEKQVRAARIVWRVQRSWEDFIRFAKRIHAAI